MDEGGNFVEKGFGVGRSIVIGIGVGYGGRGVCEGG